MEINAPSGGKSSVVLDQAPCAFCHSSKQSEGTGSFVAYAQGKEVTGNVDDFSKVIHVHLKCLAWSPRIYFEDDLIQNLESEIVRANKLKCSSCGKKGAGLGCCVKACQKTYHVPCAYGIPDCRWDDGFLILCPNHAHHKFPSEQNAKSEKKITQKSISEHLNLSSPLLNVGKDLVFCGSGLSAGDKFTLVNFASSSGSIVFKNWRDNVTHVIAGTDSNGACTRTLNVLMAILHGRWILTMEWVKACVKAGHLVKEEPYEVVLDNHGSRGGPKAGRLRVQNKAPKLFNNLNFYFIGEYEQAYKADLVNLVTTGGGTITETKDQLLTSRSNDADTKVNVKQVTLVVYNADFTYNSEFEDESSVEASRLEAAEDVAQEIRCRVVPHIWILESIACGLLVYNLL
ncbi:BRCA1-associated RING domain protein 1-like [Bidens hawaiensis]|uniref:BRCA1-associated RING domain protein 1-like n=1 Tax=Bidens hawaiensis TaxID=980011 RepID=UPI00404B3C4D